MMEIAFHRKTNVDEFCFSPILIRWFNFALDFSLVRINSFTLRPVWMRIKNLLMRKETRFFAFDILRVLTCYVITSDHNSYCLVVSGLTSISIPRMIQAETGRRSFSNEHREIHVDTRRTSRCIIISENYWLKTYKPTNPFLPSTMVFSLILVSIANSPNGGLSEGYGHGGPGVCLGGGQTEDKEIP